MKIKVTVLHNAGPGMFFGFNPETAHLHHAHDLLIEADSIDQAANLAFELTNLDVEDLNDYKALIYGNQVREYRERMNRSLSVGDVLVMRDLDHDDEPVLGVMACESLGWKGLEFVPEFAFGTNQSPVSESYRAHQDLVGRAWKV